MRTGASILVLNSGSSSLKFGVFRLEEETLLLQGSAEGIGRDDGRLHIQSGNGTVLVQQEHILETQSHALNTIATVLKESDRPAVAAVGHRVVHGGPRLRDHQRITPAVLDTLRASVHYAPLHIPLALELIEQAQKTFPAPQFACFDTAFHRTLPNVASHLPLPSKYFDEGVMRYGFHGLSCESALHQLGDRVPSRVVIAHLGNGASVTAVRDGKSVDTSMGLTPTGGIPMGTRSGDLDPGVLLYLMRTEGLKADTLEHLLNHACGMAGLSNGEGDMQALLGRSDPAAQLAVDSFCVGIRKAVGAYAALLGGIDLLIFTGGIGEHSSTVRDQIVEGLAHLGLRADGGPHGNVIILHSEEEAQIARHTRRLMHGVL